MQSAPPPPEDNYLWTQLNGPWVMTWYGGANDGNIGNHHGAYYNRMLCEDPHNPGEPMPDHVTGFHFGAALPGPEFYCVPAKVCVTNEENEEKCVVVVAMDVMRDYRIKKRGSELYFSHLDLWPEPARQLNLIDQGIHWGGIEVYIGAKK